MDKTLLDGLLSGKTDLKSYHFEALGKIVDEYPYFQPVRALRLKLAKLSADSRLEDMISKTAVYTTDRSVLYNFVYEVLPVELTFKCEEVDDKFESEASLKSYSSQVDAKMSEVVGEGISGLTTTVLDSKEIEETEKPDKSYGEQISDLGQELRPLRALDKDRKLSFDKWIEELKLYESKLSFKDEVNLKYDKVESFISNSPKKKNRRSNSGEEVIFKPKKFSSEKSELVTETLAEIYLEQKKYDKAIEAYEIMVLKYPEKSGFFAEKVEKIRKLKLFI